MNSCCHSCPKAVHLNEASSLSHRFRDAKPHLEKISSKFKIAKKVLLLSNADVGNLISTPQKNKIKWHTDLNISFQLSSWIMFLQPLGKSLLPHSLCLW